MELERLQILKMLEAGRINAEEAATLLAVLQAGGSEAQGQRATNSPQLIERQKKSGRPDRRPRRQYVPRGTVFHRCSG